MKKLVAFVLLAVCVVGCSDNKVALKGDGIQPKDPSSEPSQPYTPGPGPDGCVCQCTSFTCSFLGFWTLPDGTIGLRANYTYTMTPACETEVRYTYTAVYADGSHGPPTFSGVGNLTWGIGKLGYATNDQGGQPVGWDIEFYVIRKCDGSIVGYNQTYLAA